MKPLIGLLMAIVAGACLAADTYKWVDDKGIITYGAKPPPGRPATLVNTTPSGSIDSGSGGARPEKAETEKRRAEPAPAPVPPPVATATPVRGMEFDTYIRLQRGMTEGELLLRAGRPDHESVENFRSDIVKSWYYFPTSADPFTTTVTVRGGRIANIDRVKRF